MVFPFPNRADNWQDAPIDTTKDFLLLFRAKALNVWMNFYYRVAFLTATEEHFVMLHLRNGGVLGEVGRHGYFFNRLSTRLREKNGE